MFGSMEGGCIRDVEETLRAKKFRNFMYKTSEMKKVRYRQVRKGEVFKG